MTSDNGLTEDDNKDCKTKAIDALNSSNLLGAIDLARMVVCQDGSQDALFLAYIYCKVGIDMFYAETTRDDGIQNTFMAMKSVKAYSVAYITLLFLEFDLRFKYQNGTNIHGGNGSIIDRQEYQRLIDAADIPEDIKNEFFTLFQWASADYGEFVSDADSEYAPSHSESDGEDNMLSGEGGGAHNLF